jgi:hypothetical protein
MVLISRPADPAMSQDGFIVCFSVADPDPNPDPLVRGMDPDPDPDPDHSITKQK